MFEHFYALRFEVLAPPLLQAFSAERLVDRDPCQPSRQRGSSLEPADRRERLCVARLKHVLGVLLVLEDAPGGAEEALVVRAHDLPDRTDVARRTASGQIHVAHRGIIERETRSAHLAVVIPRIPG